jgi:TolB protein
MTLTVQVMALAQDTVNVIAVGEAELVKDKITFFSPKLNLLTGSDQKKIHTFIEILKSDFNFYKHLFEVEPAVNIELEKYSGRYFVSFLIKIENERHLLKTVLHDKQNKIILLEDERQILFNKIRVFSHDIANVVYRSITGKKSIFKSKMVFVSDRTSSRRNTSKELYLMDFDGARKQRLTHYNSMIISPSLSQDNRKILFTLIDTKFKKASASNKVQRIKNLNLYMFDLKTRKKSLLSSVAGINSGAIFNKTGDSIYLTLSYLKNADIFKMNLKTKKKTRITNHFADDVDPHINADESLLTFLSGRPGKAMIYTMDPSGTEKSVKRISFVGRFNAAPRFSPDGNEIVFSSWVDNRFDIYRIDSDGRNLVRLTKNFGSNEEPWYSPDGEFIVFTSQRVITRKRAVQDIYIMNREGEILRKVSENYGKIYTPRWSN